MLDGTLREVRFSWPEDGTDSTTSAGGEIREMQPIGESVLETNQVCYINGNFISDSTHFFSQFFKILLDSMVALKIF